MNFEDLYAEIEEDRAWREGEIHKFQNRISEIDQPDDRDQYRRALILLLYAHFEGHCKFVLSLYVSAINRAGVTCGEATPAIAAASLADLFRDLRNPQKKSDIFRRRLPDDATLHRFARDREFCERVAEWEKRAVEIPDDVVDAESNLTPTVLKKNLFRLGLPHEHFDSHAGTINKLLKIRNDISHGTGKDGVDEKLYDSLKAATFSVMTGVAADLMSALGQAAYLRRVDHA
jgi:hypothetical protein